MSGVFYVPEQPADQQRDQHQNPRHRPTNTTAQPTPAKTPPPPTGLALTLASGSRNRIAVAQRTPRYCPPPSSVSLPCSAICFCGDRRDEELNEISSSCAGFLVGGCAVVCVFGVGLLAVRCWLRTVPCMRSFRDFWLVSTTAVVVLFAAACSGDDPPAATVDPVVDTAVSSPATAAVPPSAPVVVSEPVDDTEALRAAFPLVLAWVELAWAVPASDPFGYDYSLWVDELAAPSANVDGLRADPLIVSSAEVAEQALGDLFFEQMTADLRSLLWLETALAGGDDWRVFETDPGFAVFTVAEATSEAALATPEETAHASFDGLHDPVVVRSPAGAITQILWPVVVEVPIQRTDVQIGLVRSNVRFGTTLLLVPDPAVDGGFLIEATAVPGGFMLHSAVVFPAS